MIAKEMLIPASGTPAPEAAPADSARLAADAMDVLRRIVRSLRASETATSAALGLTTAQLFVLREIDKTGTANVGELARRTATAQSSVSEVLARLLARGLVTRQQSTADRRRAEITLSPAGRGVLARAQETVQERLLAAFLQLSPELQGSAAEGLRAWIQEAGLGEVAPTMFFEPVLEG